MLWLKLSAMCKTVSLVYSKVGNGTDFTYRTPQFSFILLSVASFNHLFKLFFALKIEVRATFSYISCLSMDYDQDG